MLDSCRNSNKFGENSVSRVSTPKLYMSIFMEKAGCSSRTSEQENGASNFGGGLSSTVEIESTDAGVVHPVARGEVTKFNVVLTINQNVGWLHSQMHDIHVFEKA